MSFSASDLEILDYDFSGFYEGGPKGVVPEPSTEAITAYRLAISNLLDTTDERTQAAFAAHKKSTSDDDGANSMEEAGDEDSSDDAALNAELSKINDETWAERKRLLADLCQQSPSLEDINRLGHRVFLKFEEYVMGAWTPQAASAATS